ncbi:MAG TPA: glutamate synthase subunit beta [Pyrinomonadaceae bacterium]|nr:glutamate synthase subunit beta [Pyrinomonadaceae bacterium]
MGKITGFIEYSRSLPILQEPSRRITNWEEFHAALPESELKKQGARCMNCGIPFCHTGATFEGASIGCPLGNLIPEWNDLVYQGKWFEAYKSLASTNNFPEFTGRVCPAPCESSCVLGINEEPVMIKEIEVSIIDKAFEEGWIMANPPKNRTNKKIAVIGSGPAGLACADELNKFGHNVTIFERDDRIGGLLMYGIPNMKLGKNLVERRVNLMRDEGIEFRTSVKVGTDISAGELKNDFDAIVLACGATQARDLPVEGRDLQGIYFAMEFLLKNTKSLLDSEHANHEFIDVKDKNVIVIGGGDTGTDCIATSIRHGCQSITQFEIMPPFAEKVYNHESWLSKVRTFQIDYGQEEAKAIFGADPREYCILTKKFVGDEKGILQGLETVEVEWKDGKLSEIEGTENFWEAEKVFLAMGFTGVEKTRLFEDLGVSVTAKGTISVNENKQTSAENVFAAGDCERGQSLIVWAIADGRKAAIGVDKFLRSTCQN